MPKPLSVDLRQRVIDSVDQGIRITDVAKTFKICRRVIYQWLSLKGTKGNLEPKSDYQNGHSHKITDWEKFKAFANEHKHLTIKEMRIIWEQITGTTMSNFVIQKALKKIDFTFKKKHSAMRKPIPKSARHT